jgi:hypothetical protein
MTPTGFPVQFTPFVCHVNVLVGQLTAVKSVGLEPIGSVYWARFDPPYKPAFLRRNEALIRVKDLERGKK